jgi:hypothetical protein
MTLELISKIADRGSEQGAGWRKSGVPRDEQYILRRPATQHWIPRRIFEMGSSVMSTKKYWVKGLIFILINSIFPQGNLYHTTQHLEESYEKVHYSVIHGGT